MPEKVIKTRKIDGTKHVKFQLHPGVSVPLANLAWVKVPLRAYTKAATEHSMPHLNERHGAWALACAHNGLVF